MGLAMVCVYASALLANVAVSFVNYDMGRLNGTYPNEPIPDGTMLYTAADLEGVDGFQPSADCTWYLYKEATDGEDAFGPTAIPDPPARVGYEFYDWASLNTISADGLHTVKGDTVFLARYARSGQYLVNFYYQYNDDTRSVAAPTTSTGQNPPAFANLTFQYGCYNGADVYFFYTYNNYTLTYYENNPDLTGNRPLASPNIPFHYVSGKPLKDTLAVPNFVHDYEPDEPYICQYGNQHLFAGW